MVLLVLRDLLDLLVLLVLLVTLDHVVLQDHKETSEVKDQKEAWVQLDHKVLKVFKEKKAKEVLEAKLELLDHLDQMVNGDQLETVVSLVLMANKDQKVKPDEEVVLV